MQTLHQLTRRINKHRFTGLRHIAAFTILFVLSADVSNTANGCSCGVDEKSGTAKAFYERAATVFEGQIVDIRDDVVFDASNSTSSGNFNNPNSNETKTAIVTCFVHRAWKGLDQYCMTGGAVVPTQYAVTVFKTLLGDSATCGLSFDVGEEYLFYTTMKEGEVWVDGICGSRYVDLHGTDAPADISYLKQQKKLEKRKERKQAQQNKKTERKRSGEDGEENVGNNR